jgi:hypothetical protein
VGDATMIRFEKTAFGWKAYRKQNRAYVYFGHFYTQAEAKRVYFEEVAQ